MDSGSSQEEREEDSNLVSPPALWGNRALQAAGTGVEGTHTHFALDSSTGDSTQDSSDVFTDCESAGDNWQLLRTVR